MVSENELDLYLVDLFETYDSIDLIATLSALNLKFENQNKNILTSYATIYALCGPFYDDRPKASVKTIKKLSAKLSNCYLTSQIDPSESSFFEFVYYDREYGVFNGINTSSAFYINSILEMLLYRNSTLKSDFKQKAIRLIQTGLLISDKIFRSLDLNFDKIAEHDYIKEVVVPLNLEALKECVFIEKSFLSEFISGDELSKYFVCPNEVRNANVLKQDFIPFYYSCPLYDCGDKYLVIDPTAICSFLKELCLRLADEYNCKDLFVKELNYSLADISIEKSKMLCGVDKTSKVLDFAYIRSDNYASEAYMLNDGKIVLIVCLFIDENIGYKGNYDQYIEECIKMLNINGISSDDVYLIILYHSLNACPILIKSSIKIKNNPVFISCSELPSIFENEKNNPFYFLSFIDFTNYYFSEHGMSMIYSFANLIASLNMINYDFYFGDDIRVKSSFLNMAFDYLYPYHVKACKLSAYTVAAYEGISIPIQLIHYDDNLYFPNPLTCRFNNVVTLYLKIHGIYGFWLIFKPENDRWTLIARVFAYWINQVKEEIFKKLNSNYYIQIDKAENMKVHRINHNKCLLFYSDNYFESFSNNDNSNEISIVVNVLSCLGLIDDSIIRLINKESKVKYRKIIYLMDVNDVPCFEPLRVSLLPIRISKIYKSMFDDMIGDYLIENIGMKPGKVENPQDLINSIVNYLFAVFEKYISQFSWFESIRLGYLYVEDFLQRILLFRENMKHQIALYPEHEEDITDNYNNLNSTSVSLRFVIEYLSTIRPNGSKSMSGHDFQYASTLVSSIIKWARIGDSIKYNLINQISILNSWRIGFDHSNIAKFNELVSETSSFDTSHGLEFDYEKYEEWPYKEEFDKAYFLEYGFTTKELMETIIIFHHEGLNQQEEIKIANLNKLLSLLHTSKYDFNDETFLKVVEYLTIPVRDKFYDGTIKPRDLHPWKYNRLYSLVRKPIINCGDFYMWGSRSIYHAYLYIMQVIRSGKEPSNRVGKDSINSINGKILSFTGDRFNEYCFEYLKTIMKEVSFFIKVSSINSKKIAYKNGNVLGDIDILGIDKVKKRIYLIETKNFYYSRDPSELDIEIKEMFSTNEKRKSFLELELNRVNWVNEHLDDVVAEYHLEKGPWKVAYTFLTNKPLISKEFVDFKVNSISLKNITIKYLRKLNTLI